MRPLAHAGLHREVAIGAVVPQPAETSRAIGDAVADADGCCCRVGIVRGRSARSFGSSAVRAGRFGGPCMMIGLALSLRRDREEATLERRRENEKLREWCAHA